MGYSPDPIFLEQCPADVKALFTGERLYAGRRMARRLGEAVGAQSDALAKAAAEKAKKQGGPTSS